MRNWLFGLFCLAIVLNNAQCQEYIQVERGARPSPPSNRGLFMVGSLCTIIGGCIGGAITYRNAKIQFEKEKTDFVKYIKLQEAIFQQKEEQWSSEYKKLYKAYEEKDREIVERDFEEFKAPDLNNDDLISLEEFNTYVRKYLSSFPELSETNFPRFEEFDLNKDGMVSFEEWQQFLHQQRLTELQSVKSDDSSSPSSTTSPSSTSSSRRSFLQRNDEKEKKESSSS